MATSKKKITIRTQEELDNFFKSLNTWQSLSTWSDETIIIEIDSDKPIKVEKARKKYQIVAIKNSHVFAYDSDVSARDQSYVEVWDSFVTAYDHNYVKAHNCWVMANDDSQIEGWDKTVISIHSFGVSLNKLQS